MGLNLCDSYEKVVDLLGKPKQKAYEVVGDYQLTDQSLYTFMIYDGAMITTRKFFDTDKYLSEEGILEIDISSKNYATKKGIEVGDTLDKVVKTYNIIHVYPFSSTTNDEIMDMFSDRINKTNTYIDRDFFYEYEYIDKMAYIIPENLNEKYNYLPALIFLFQDDKVSHIILYNTREIQ